MSMSAILIAACWWVADIGIYNIFIESCGWIGCIFLAICGIPEAKAAIQTKRTGLTGGLLFMWFFGELFAMIYVAGLGSWPLLLNYGLNITILLPVIWYKFYPGGRKSKSE